ncbi:MAG: ImmA/IrrE family metallo-endopeptidase [Deltaproteobacteria bacterium]|nr:ImmA/IrrE family metallo-endopeptidase [Deltaproteobacteria bacterium]
MMRILRKSLDYFTDPLLLLEPKVFSWRTQAPPSVIDAYENKARNIVAALRRFSEQLGERFSPLSFKLHLSKRSTFEEAWEAGESLVERFALGEVPATELHKAVEGQMNIALLYVDPPKSISGAACRLPEFNAVLINRNEVPWRRNYDVAHEVFHLLTWDIMPPLPHEVVHDDPSKGPRVEQLAENFSAGLLMPRKSLRTKWEQRGKGEIHEWILDTATEYCVSGQALFYRLKNLKWMSDADIQRINLDRLKMPKDACKEKSKPKLYSQVFVDRLRRTLEKGLISVRKAASLLDCTIEDLEDLFHEYGMKVPFDL